jgi:hypothetical protein
VHPSPNRPAAVAAAFPGDEFAADMIPVAARLPEPRSGLCGIANVANT